MAYESEQNEWRVDRLSYNPMHDYRAVDVDAWAMQWFASLADLDPNGEEYQEAEHTIQRQLYLHPTERDVDGSDLHFGVGMLRLLGGQNPYDASAESADERQQHEGWDRAQRIGRLIGRQIVRVTLEEAERYAALRIEQERSGTDYLTGLTNRRGLSRRLEEQYGITDDPTRRARSGEPLPPIRITHLYCDANRFKWINRMLGHHVGDAAILEAAWRVQDAFRQADMPVIYRHGGDEFGVVLGNLSDYEVEELTKRINRLQVERIMSAPYREAITRAEERIQAITDAGKRVRAEVHQPELTQGDIALRKRPHYTLYINGEPVTPLQDMVSLSVGVTSGFVSTRDEIENLRRRSEEAMERAKAVLHGIMTGTITAPPEIL